jgi:hypothetical protein
MQGVIPSCNTRISILDETQKLSNIWEVGANPHQMIDLDRSIGRQVVVLATLTVLFAARVRLVLKDKGACDGPASLQLTKARRVELLREPLPTHGPTKLCPSN